jgi:pilus assembly protein Flp/PilA
MYAFLMRMLFNSDSGLMQMFLDNDSGATAIEYGLIAALIAVAAVSVMTTVGHSLSTTFNTVATKL